MAQKASGMTLVEVITAAVIFVIAATIMLSGFMYMLTINKKAVEMVRSTSELNIKIDKSEDLTETGASVDISVGGADYKIEGAYVSAEYDDRYGVSRKRTTFTE